MMKPNHMFLLLGAVELTCPQRTALSLLYQPIIGVDAFSLYETLRHLPINSPHKHHLLLQITGWDMTRLLQGRNRLEGAGLIEVYETDDGLTYCLKPSLTVQQFFNDAMMRAFLAVKIGNNDFTRLKDMLLEPQIAPAGEKTTKRFDEVYDIKTLTRAKPIFLPVAAGTTADAGIHVKQVVDETLLLGVLQKKGMGHFNLGTDVLSVLNELAFLYKFDEHELATLVFDSALPDGTVDQTKMRQRARGQFQLVSKGLAVEVVVKGDEEDQIFKNSPVATDHFISFMEQSPMDFLQFKSGGKPPVPSEMKLVEWLFTDQGMPAGVVNVLVDYVLNYTGGNLPKPLVERIAAQWQRQNVRTTEEAMAKVKSHLTKSHDYKKEKEKPVSAQPHQLMKRATRVEPIPEWLGQRAPSEGSTEDSDALDRIAQMKKMLSGGEADA